MSQTNPIPIAPQKRANAAQLHSLRSYAQIGYDLAATDPEFFKK